jgi:hypothetical protein
LLQAAHRHLVEVVMKPVYALDELQPVSTPCANEWDLAAKEWPACKRFRGLRASLRDQERCASAGGSGTGASVGFRCSSQEVS